ncbi:DNA/RNA non-specific endonuclease [Hymenobacter yonginensis]|uniref:DNA/RNA non-specific endonuclease n=1 Tax=Hymenobacter yonginensis TaxID=748197 RepID=A0ABY7PPI0_9BACT|nr:DNA/RNA non-specific endonuclease [Hymenobacter yonginensis]WBO84098.1 DNA/RNA non-specific endonuclease [Hymenobacter yonginensis]
MKFHFAWAAALLLTASCAKQDLSPATPAATATSTADVSSAGFPEGFNTGTKTAYTTGSVTLGSGSWTLNDALLGNTTADRKTGAQSVRVRNVGSLTMNFNATTGAGVVTVQHAVYGTDAASQWELWVSQNSGSSYAKVGSTITSSSTALSTASFTVNLSGNVRLQIRKTSGGTNRINFDNVTVEQYSGTTPPPPPPVAGDNQHLTMGNPSGAAADVSMPTNYLLNKPQYALSYHRDRGIPNWVSWHLDTSWRGSAARQDDFRADNTLPAGWYQVQATSYSGSGFDRGHNCPSADRTNTVANNSATFLMTNMIPQSPNNNQITWAALENYSRTLMDQGNELYIIMGAYGRGGTGSAGYFETIDQGRIQVPARVWKVLVVLPVGSTDVSRVSAATRIIAIDTPNQQGLTSNWGQYRTSVDAIEAATGLDLLSALPASVQQVVEAQVDNGPTN